MIFARVNFWNLLKWGNTMNKLFLFFGLILVSSSSFFAQSSGIDFEGYKNFLSAHANLTTSQISEMYPANKFKAKAENLSGSPVYFDSIDAKFKLTRYEKELLSKHGFMVTERLKYKTYGDMMLDVYQKDLPLFITTDAILHAFHMSYDIILMNVEQYAIIPKLKNLLNNLNGKLPELVSKYSSNEKMLQSLKDVDVYLNVASKLIDRPVQPYYPDNSTFINNLLNLIEHGEISEAKLFSESWKDIDFSQFKPRGHYTKSEELKQYFKTMMWFGRIELYLSAPKSTLSQTSEADIRRQTLDAALISELFELADAYQHYEEIENTIKSFVGEQDNVTLDNFNDVLNSANISSADELLDSANMQSFRDILAAKPFASQKILSQILFHDPTSPDSIQPASGFLLFGQRFIIDSYITGGVVYDKIKFNGQFVKRMLPSTLDVLFALGNNAALQLLTPELDKYLYGTNLAALRYLVDNYSSGQWSNSIYNLWLNSIRTLNPPGERSTLPEFMQTGAWWQQKMNTQLASWAELRHDNLLYAKQSYSGGVGCYFPGVYVEPFPKFYLAMKLLAEKSKEKIANISLDAGGNLQSIDRYFSYFADVCDTLYSISIKELKNTALLASEKSFLAAALRKENVCGEVITGWYPNLYYNKQEGLFKEDYLIADYHTAPTDEDGNIIGWVKHAGTGPVNLSVINVNRPDGKTYSYAGPVYSYYEYTSVNFERLTDEEWAKTSLSKSMRPDWVNIFLADSTGNSLGDGSALITGLKNESSRDRSKPDPCIYANNFPNPFNGSTTIAVTLPRGAPIGNIEIIVYNIQGEAVKHLLNKQIPSGSYLLRWNGTNDYGKTVSSGIYIYKISNGTLHFSGKMNLLK